jgi:hypothetical protein
VVEKGSPEVGANVGDLFSNAMSQEQGNTENINVKILHPSKHYFPLRDNDFRTKVVKDVPSSKQHINEERNIWNIKDNTNSYLLPSTHFCFIIKEK